MLSGFVVEFHSLAAAARPAVGAIYAAEVTGPPVCGWPSPRQDNRRPGNFRPTAIAKDNPFDLSHSYLLKLVLSFFGRLNPQTHQTI
jgi:hypothetical protein